MINISNLLTEVAILLSEAEGEKTDILNGRAVKNNFTEKDADQIQLDMGIKIEAEHTDESDTAKKIALDHLSEFPTYYSALTDMESQLAINAKLK